MIFLLLSIVCTSMIFITFKWVGRLNFKLFQVIVMNYLVAGILGWLIDSGNSMEDTYNAAWFYPTVALGFTFTGMFYLIGRATHNVGAALTSLVNKMSVIIPVAAAFILYSDDITFLKIGGIILALIGILLASLKKGSGKVSKGGWLLIFIFVGSGLIDTLINFYESFYLSDKDILTFTALLFLSAFFMGIIILMSQFRKTVKNFNVKSIRYSLLLGLVNFGSIYFLIQALKHSNLESSVLFPLNNIGVVVLSATLSVLLFQEKLSRKNIAGIGISVLALVFLLLSAY